MQLELSGKFQVYGMHKLHCINVNTEGIHWETPPGGRESCVVNHQLLPACSWANGQMGLCVLLKFHKAMCLHVISIISLVLHQWFSNIMLRKITQRTCLKNVSC